MTESDRLRLAPETRQRLWRDTVAAIEAYLEGVAEVAVAPTLEPEALQASLERFDFDTPLAPTEALQAALDGLWGAQLHTPHPRYFGLFNPAPTTMGIAADALTAAFNPQLASWSHSPFANELERHLLRRLGGRFGYPEATLDGTFCSGGAEANHTALLAALTHAFPEVGRGGLRALSAAPTLYVSDQSHHSLLKAARLCGLGSEAVRSVSSDAFGRLDVDAARRLLADDRAAGRAPFLLVATAGTTNAGAIDPLDALVDLASAEGLWLHVDAAWGGAAVFSPELRPALGAVERADSITFDAHKWLSVPMGAGAFLTRHREVLSATFDTQADYMPRSDDLGRIDPYLHTMQWSRRFIGLKVFLSLAVAGWEGYRRAIERQTHLGRRLRRRLQEEGWRLVNATPLPVVCFVADDDAVDEDAVADAVVAGGRAWLSTTRLGGRSVLRACITNFASTEGDLEVLLEELARARRGRPARA